MRHIVCTGWGCKVWVRRYYRQGGVCIVQQRMFLLNIPLLLHIKKIKNVLNRMYRLCRTARVLQRMSGFSSRVKNLKFALRGGRARYKLTPLVWADSRLRKAHLSIKKSYGTINRMGFAGAYTTFFWCYLYKFIVKQVTGTVMHSSIALLWYDNQKYSFLPWYFNASARWIAVEQTSQVSTFELFVLKQRTLVDEVLFAYPRRTKNIPAYCYFKTTSTDIWYGLSGANRPYFYCSANTFILSMLALFRGNYTFSQIMSFSPFEQQMIAYRAIISNYIHLYAIYKCSEKYVLKTTNLQILIDQQWEESTGATRLLIFSFKKHSYKLTFACYYFGSIFTYSTGMFIPNNLKLFRSKSRRKQILKYLRSLKKKKRKQERRKLGLTNWKCLRRKFFLKVAMSRYVAALLTKCIRGPKLNIFIHGAVAHFRVLWHIMFCALQKHPRKDKTIWRQRRKYHFMYLYFSNRYRTTETRRRVKRRIYKRLKL